MIELLPKEAEETAGLQVTTKVGLVSLFILLVSGSVYLHTIVLEYQQKTSQAAAEIKKLARREKELAAEIKQAQKYRQIASQANLADYTRIVADLKVVIPQQVWLKEFQINSQQQVIFSGKAEETVRIINVLQRMMKYPYFAHLKLQTRQQVKPGFSFRIVGRIKNGR